MIGIVSTIRSWGPAAEAWCAYHAALGFDRQYIFVDDANLPTCDIPGVCRVACTLEHWTRNAGDEFSYLLAPTVYYEGPRWGEPPLVMIRQIVNASVGVSLACEDGVSWLVHLDLDERLWLDTPLAQHFAQLDALGIDRVRFLNLEAVSGEPRPLYKRNPASLSARQWTRIRELLGSRAYFCSHTNGKGAIRVMDGVKPQGVHGFENDKGLKGDCILACPAIAHRPYRDVEDFCAKHVHMGAFVTTEFLGSPWRPPKLLEQAQPFVQRGDRAGLATLYREATIWEPEIVQQLQSIGVIVELAGLEL